MKYTNKLKKVAALQKYIKQQDAQFAERNATISRLQMELRKALEENDKLRAQLQL